MSSTERSMGHAWVRAERLKAKARLLALLIRAEAEGMDVRAASRFVRQHRHEVALPPEIRPLGIGPTSIWKWFVFLEIENGRLSKRKRTGSRATKAALMGVRP
jgi:hypothetical protein